MNIDRYRERRARALQAMMDRGGGVAVHFTAPERLRNRDSGYPYRYDSSFWYLSGFAEPDSALVLVAHGSRRQALLFCREKHDESEIWDGFRYGPELAQVAFGFDAAHAIDRIDEVLPELMAEAARAWAVEAVALYERFLRVDPDNIAGWHNLATLQEGLGQWDRARSSWRQALTPRWRAIPLAPFSTEPIILARTTHGTISTTTLLWTKTARPSSRGLQNRAAEYLAHFRYIRGFDNQFNSIA